jgi:hypothetical protein
VLSIHACAVDVVKTRYMSDSAGLFRGPMHCAVVALKAGGPAAFFQVSNAIITPPPSSQWQCLDEQL